MEDGERHHLRLSPRERDVLQLLAEGLDVPSIAVTLGVSHATVRTHMRAARARLKARTRPHAIALALVRGEIPGVAADTAVRSAASRR